MSGDAVSAQALARYAAFFEALTPESLGGIAEVAARDIRFKDPFSDVVGLDRVEAIFRHMFEAMDEPRFVVIDSAAGKTSAYLKWRFTGRLKKGSLPVEIVGVSEVTFGPDGKAVEHIDHWDAASAVYGRVPVLGAMLRWLGRRFAPVS